MSFFDFVGALGAGGGEMARTISDIQRRKLEEQENMDRIAMQREQMAGLDRRFDAGISADTESARLLQEGREGAATTLFERDVSLNEDNSLTPDGAVEWLDMADRPSTIQAETERGWRQEDARTQAGFVSDANQQRFDFGETANDNQVIRDQDFIDLQRADNYAATQVAHIIGKSGGNPDMAREAVIGAGLATADDIEEALAAGTVMYQSMLSADGAFGMPRYPGMKAMEFGMENPPPVASSNVEAGDGNGIGTGGGIPERIGSAAAGVRGLLREGVGNQMDALGQTMRKPFNLESLQFGDATAKSLDARMMTAYRASQIRAALDRGEISEAQASEQLAALEAAGGN